VVECFVGVLARICVGGPRFGRCAMAVAGVRALRGALSRWLTGWDDLRVDLLEGAVGGECVAVVQGAPVPG
jgi:hypothetical protein